jgi:predicted RNase H-like HicB family nuclease
MKHDKYAVVIEKGDQNTNYGAYVPDLPGCVAVGETQADVEKLIAEAITLHLDSLRQHGDPVPVPSAVVEYIEPAAVA